MLAANDAAKGLGVYPGAAAARAQALAADLIIQDADLEGDRDGLHKLALWLLKAFSPIVAPGLPRWPDHRRHRLIASEGR